MSRVLNYNFSFSVFLFLVSFKVYGQDTLETSFIKNTHIKTCVEYLTFLDKPNSEKFKCQKKYFNKKGQDTLVIIYSITTGNIFSKIEKFFDKFGNMSKRIEYKAIQNKNAKNKSYKKVDYSIEIISISEFSAKGRLVRRQDYDKDMNIIRTVEGRHEFDENGRVKQFIYNSTNPRESYRDVFDYDSLGKKIRYTYYNQNGLDSHLEYSYDTNNRLCKTNIFRNKTKLKETEIFVYDSTGKRIKKQTLDSAGNVYLSQKFIYDMNGNLIELIREESDIKSDFSILKMTYDKYGNITTNIKYNSKNIPFRKQEFVYTYYK